MILDVIVSFPNSCLALSLYYVLVIVMLVLYRILRLIIFIPRFAEIWGRASMCVCAWALYPAVDRPEGRAFFSVERYSGLKTPVCYAPNPTGVYYRQRAGSASLGQQCGLAEK